MTEAELPPLEVVSADFRAVAGRLQLQLNRDPRRVDQTLTFFQRDMRGASTEVYPVDTRLLEVLRYLLLDSLSAFYAIIEGNGDRTFLMLGIAPSDEFNHYGIISSGNHLVQALSRLVGVQETSDYVELFGRLTDPDSARRHQGGGYNAALKQVGAEIVNDVGNLLNMAFSVPQLRLPQAD